MSYHRPSDINYVSRGGGGAGGGPTFPTSNYPSGHSLYPSGNYNYLPPMSSYPLPPSNLSYSSHVSSNSSSYTPSYVPSLLPLIKIWLQLEFGEPHLAEELNVDPSWSISRLKQELATAGLFKSIKQPSDIDCILYKNLKVKTSVTVSELPEIQANIFYIRPTSLVPALAPPLPAYNSQPQRRNRSPERGNSNNKRRLLETDVRYDSRAAQQPRVIGAYNPQMYPVFTPSSAALASNTLAVGVKATRAEQEAIKILQGVPSYVGDSGGVDAQTEHLANLFYTRLRERCHTLTKRGALSALFLASLPSWAPPEVAQDPVKQRPFKQILHALSKGMEVCDVLEKGKALKWVDIHSARSLKYLEHNVDVIDAKSEYSAGGCLLRSDVPMWGTLQGSSASLVAWSRRPLYFEVRVQRGTIVRLGFVRLGSDPMSEGLSFESTGLKWEGQNSFMYGKKVMEKDNVSALLYYYDSAIKTEGKDEELFAHAASDNLMTPGQPPVQGTRSVCKYFLQAKCSKGQLCPFKHVKSSSLSSSGVNPSSLTPSSAEFCRIEFAVNGISQGVAFTVPADLFVPFVAVQQATVQVVFDQGPLQFRPSCVPMTTIEFFEKTPKPETVAGNVCTFWLKGESGCTRADCKFLHQVPTETND